MSRGSLSLHGQEKPNFAAKNDKHAELVKVDIRIRKNQSGLVPTHPVCGPNLPSSSPEQTLVLGAAAWNSSNELDM